MSIKKWLIAWLTIRGSSSIVTHPSSNQARRRSTALIRRSATCAASHGYRELRLRAEEMRRYIDELYAQVEPGLVLLPPTDKHRRRPNLSVPHLLLSATPAQRIQLSESFQVLRDVERRVSERRHFQHADVRRWDVRLWRSAVAYFHLLSRARRPPYDIVYVFYSAGLKLQRSFSS